MSRLLAAALLFLAGAAALHLATRGPGAVEPIAPAAPATPTGGQPANPAALDRPTALDSGAKRQAAADSAAAADAPPESEPDVSAPVPTGLVVEGRLRDGPDGPPAAHAELLVDHAGGLERVTADAEGRFRTTAVVAPGVVELRHRASDPAGPFPLRRELTPPTAVVAGAPGDVVTVDVVLRSPDATLLVDVVLLDGRPALGASVELEGVREARPGALEHVFSRALADERGRARFALYDLEALRAAGVIAREAEADRPEPTGARCSALEILDVPLHAAALEHPLRLVLDEPASVLARVVAQDGRPIPGERVALDDLVPELGWWTGPLPVTDERGEARLSALPPGDYRVRLLDSPEVPAVDVTLVAGERGEVVFHVERAAPLLAVAGRLVDEEGAPLAERPVNVRLGRGPKATTVTVATDADGRFEARAAPVELVEVSANCGVFSDVFAPASLEVAFGTTDLVLRRTMEVHDEEVAFEVVDAGTDELVPDVLVMTYRAPRTGDYSFHRARDGRAHPRLPLHDDTRLVVEAPGYRRRTLQLSELERGGDAPPRVELERGVLRELRVVDDEGAPVAGARVLDGGRLLGSTDADGRFWLDLRVDPAAGVHIEAEGRSPAIWSPADGFAELAPAVVTLEALAAPVTPRR